MSKSISDETVDSEVKRWPNLRNWGRWIVVDFVIRVDCDELAAGELSPENRRLATQLLMCNGFVVLRGALPIDLVSAMKQEFDEIESDCVVSTAGKPLENIPWLSNSGTTFWISNARLRAFIRMKGPFADPRVVANPFALNVMTDVLGEKFYCNSVSSDACMQGSAFQSPHRDIGFYPAGQTRGTIMNVPLMHCGDHNGPLEVWFGGTHLWTGQSFRLAEMRAFDQDVANPEMERFARRLPSVRIELLPGDILLRDPGTLHRGTPNPVAESRVMLTIGYFREGETYPFGDPSYNLDLGLYEQLHPDVRRLMEIRFRSGGNYPALRG